MSGQWSESGHGLAEWRAFPVDRDATARNVTCVARPPITTAHGASITIGVHGWSLIWPGLSGATMGHVG